MKKGTDMMKKVFALVVVMVTTQAINLNAAYNAGNSIQSDTNQLAGLAGVSLDSAGSFDDLNSKIRSSVSALSSDQRTGILVNFISGISGDLQSQINQLITFGSSPASQTTDFNGTVQAACAQKIANIYNQVATNPAYTASIQKLIQTYINSNLLSAADKANFQTYLTPTTPTAQLPVAPVAQVDRTVEQPIAQAAQVVPQAPSALASQDQNSVAVIQQTAAPVTQQVIAQQPIAQVVQSTTAQLAAQPLPIAVQPTAPVAQPILTAQVQTTPVVIPQTQVVTPQGTYAPQASMYQQQPFAFQRQVNPYQNQPVIYQRPITPQMANGSIPMAIGTSTTLPQARTYQATPQALYAPQTAMYQQQPFAFQRQVNPYQNQPVMYQRPITPQMANGSIPMAIGTSTTLPQAQTYQTTPQGLYAPQTAMYQQPQQPHFGFQEQPLTPQGFINQGQHPMAFGTDYRSQIPIFSVDPSNIVQSIQAINHLPHLTLKIQAAYKMMQDASRSSLTYTQQVQDAFSSLLTKIFAETEIMQNTLMDTVNDATTTPLLNQQQQNFVITQMVPALSPSLAHTAAANPATIKTQGAKKHHKKKHSGLTPSTGMQTSPTNPVKKHKKKHKKNKTNSVTATTQQ